MAGKMVGMSRAGGSALAGLWLGLALGGGPLALPAAGQETDDRGYLQTLLEDSLSGDGQRVTIEGFSGALSSTAVVERITIADEQGVWLVIRDAELAWTRSALLRGAVEIERLAAAEIHLMRLPADATGSAPETQDFALPELPVSVVIETVETDLLRLDAPVLGQSVEASVAGSLRLEQGEGAADLRVIRLDEGPEGRVALSAEYANATGRLAIDLAAQEGAGGIAAGHLGLPGQPAAVLTVQGAGPIGDFEAVVDLSTDGVTRLSGALRLGAGPEGETRFSADLRGNAAPLFLPEHAPFLGEELSLVLAGQRAADGGIRLDELALKGGQIGLGGALVLDGSYHPVSFDLTGQIANPQGGPVLLPSPADRPLRLQRADLALAFDAARGDGWTGSIRIEGLDQPETEISLAEIAAEGTIRREAGGQTRTTGAVDLRLEGLSPRQAALARALGAVIWGKLGFDYSETEGRLALSGIDLAGDGYGLVGDLRLGGLQSQLELDGQLSLQAEDLSRLSDLAGRRLGGAGRVDWSGRYGTLNGAFDGQLQVAARDLSLGAEAVDRLLAGRVLLRLDGKRDGEGLQLRAASLSGDGLSGQASGWVRSRGVALEGDLRLASLGRVQPGWAGQIEGRFAAEGPAEALRLQVQGQGRDLGFGQADLDKLLAGAAQLSVSLERLEGMWVARQARLETAQLTAKASGRLDDRGQSLAEFDARLANLGLVLPDFPGPVTLTGNLADDGRVARISARGTGPGRMEARLEGQVGRDGQSDLAIVGRAMAGLANPFLSPRSLSGELDFDLRLRGELGLRALSGPVRLRNGRLADPSLPFNLTGMAGEAALSEGAAALRLSGEVSSGGRFEAVGRSGLAAPFDSDVAVRLQELRLRDPELYDIRLAGQSRIEGPLQGGARISGQITVDQAELRVPSTTAGAVGGLTLLQHRNEPGAVRETRRKAGLLGPDAAAGSAARAALAAGPVFPLDIVIDAPSRVFVRGRGLDAELGGRVRLQGTTARVQPEGGMRLVRGRLDILGKRLDLAKADFTVEGALIPTIDVEAVNLGRQYEVTIGLRGPASDPVISFTASPDLPEEEVLAALLFDQNVQNLSAFQAVQLASAVASLAGRGGEGIITRLRKGAGLDNLDIRTDAAGAPEVALGKYLTREIYSEVTIDQSGTSRIDLNLDLNATTKLKARTSSDGSSGVGIYLEKDY